MSRCVELPTAALTALTGLLAITNDEFNQLPKDRIRQQLRTRHDLATSLNGLPALPSISQQCTPAPLEQNPHFQQLQQRVQDLTNETERIACQRTRCTYRRMKCFASRRTRPGGKVQSHRVTTLQIGSYSELHSSPYGIPSGNHIEDRPVYLVYYR